MYTVSAVVTFDRAALKTKYVRSVLHFEENRLANERSCWMQAADLIDRWTSWSVLMFSSTRGQVILDFFTVQIIGLNRSRVYTSVLFGVHE